MVPEELLLARNWVRKARRDLDSARRLAGSAEPYLDTAIYHCQQAAEKAVKGLLAYWEQPFEKTHDIRLLIAEVVMLEPTLRHLGDDADLLTPYATAYRYPDEEMEPTRAEFETALAAAERVYRAVLEAQPTLSPHEK